jgi:hypothetical protein
MTFDTEKRTVKSLTSCLVLLVLAAIQVVGCNSDDTNTGGDPGPSGVNQDTTFDQLAANEIDQFCIWAINAQGGPGEKSCSKTMTITTPTVEECVDEAQTLPCRVQDAETCIRSLNGNPCGVLSSETCAPYVECASS